MPPSSARPPGTGSGLVLALAALFVLAPLLAVVVISALLLFGVDPHLVFSLGFALQSRLRALGFHVPNSVAVASTAVLCWAIIVVLWLGFRRLLRRAR